MALWDVGILGRITRSYLADIFRKEKEDEFLLQDFGSCSEDLGKELHLKELSIRSFLIVFKKCFFMACFYGFISSGFELLRIYFVFGALLRFLSDVSQPQWFGWLLCVLLLFGNFAFSLCFNQYLEEAAYFASKVKANLYFHLVRQALCQQEDESMLSRRIGRLIGSDGAVAANCFMLFPGIVSGALYSIIMGVFAYITIGWIVLSFLPLSVSLIIVGEIYGRRIADHVGILFDRVGKEADFAKNVFDNIYHIKTQVLEAESKEQFRNLTADTSKAIKKTFLAVAVDTILGKIQQTAPRLIVYSIVLSLQSQFDLETFFLSLTLISAMRTGLSEVFAGVSKLGLARKTVKEFEELKGVPYEFSFTNGIAEKKSCVVMTDVELGYDENFVLKAGHQNFLLNDWNFVVGPSGTGKTLLLLGMLGIAPVQRGKILLSETPSVCFQKPFLMEASLRDNILFGLEYDAARFEKVLYVASLEEDLEQLVDRDAYEVSSEGTNLSGGQRQRVGIARCLYSNSKLLIFDCPLSALDATVKAKIWKRMKLLTCGKSVIFYTGDEELRSSEYGLLRLSPEGNVAYEVGYGGEIQQKESAITMSPRNFEMKQKKEQEKEKRLLVAVKARIVSSTYYKIYLQKTFYMWSGVMILSVLSSASLTVSSFWLSLFINGQVSISIGWWIVSYGGFMAASVLLSGIAGGLLAFKLAKYMEQWIGEVFSALLLTAYSFFVHTPSGEIVSRFSTNRSQAIYILHVILFYGTSFLAEFLAIIILMGIVSPFSIAILPLLLVSLLAVYRHHRLGVLSIQRHQKTLEASLLGKAFEFSRGKIAINLSENTENIAKGGIDSVRHEANLFFLTNLSQRGLQVRLDFLVYGFVFLASALVTILRGTSEYLGLMLSDTFNLGIVIGAMVRSIMRTESVFVSMERILKFLALEPEAKEDEGTMPQNWPNEGIITFQNVTLRYGPHLPPVLRNISAVFSQGKSFGIVGRTGAGKSTLFAVLMRLFSFEGRILIDGLDITKTPVRLYRQRIVLISQEPYIGSKLVRDFLHTKEGAVREEDVIEVFKLLNLPSKFSNLSENISSLGLSPGQKQLFCIARAFLNKSRIVLVDEGTSSLEQDSANEASRILQTMDPPCTLISIAHQLSTVIECSGIMVLDRGRVVDFAHPKELLQKDSAFRDLVENLKDRDKKEILQAAERQNRDHFHGCEICRDTFSRMKLRSRCKKCRKNICTLCSLDEVCALCLSGHNSAEIFFFLGAIQFRDKMEMMQCQSCDRAFSLTCSGCKRNFCHSHIITIRDIWGLKPYICYECLAAFSNEILSVPGWEHEAYAELEQIECAKFDRSPVFGTCLQCKEKGGIEACHNCCKYVCDDCSAWIYPSPLVETSSKLICVDCAKSVKPTYTWGEFPAFISLTEKQKNAISEKAFCSSCLFQYTPFLQPFECESCANQVCRRCCTGPTREYANVCLSCRKGRRILNKSAAVICDYCLKPAKVDEIVSVNQEQLHYACVPLHRNERGVRTCVFCEKLLPQSETVLFNGAMLHSSCLAPFRKKQISLY